MHHALIYKHDTVSMVHDMFLKKVSITSSWFYDAKPHDTKSVKLQKALQIIPQEEITIMKNCECLFSNR